MEHLHTLIKIADQFDLEGRFEEADKIDSYFKEFLKLLEEGKLNFDYTYSGGARDPRLPYSNPGRPATPIYGIEGS